MLENLRGYWSYRVVDRLRLEDPREAVRLANLAVQRADPRLIPWLLGTVGSSLRRLGHLRPARDLFEQALRLAKSFGDRRLWANLQQRIAHVYCDLGDSRTAILCSNTGIRLYLQLDDRVGQGQSMVDLGNWFYHLEEYGEALECNRLALRLLPTSEVDHRFSALLSNAYCLEQLGDLEGADRWTEIAQLHSEGVKGALLASLYWMRGKLAARRSQYSKARKRFEDAHKFYVDRGFPLFAAATAIELCEVLLLMGRPDEAKKTAMDSKELVKHLEESKVVKGIVITLSESAAAGRPITLKFLADLRQRLAKAKD